MNRYVGSLGITIGIGLLIAGLYFNQIANNKEKAAKDPCVQTSK